MERSGNVCPCSLAMEEELAGGGSMEKPQRRYDIYFDNNATTPISKTALESVVDVYTKYDANPSSVHFHGASCKSMLQKARAVLLGLLDADEGRATVLFTSGCTEANNAVIKGVMDSEAYKDGFVATTPIEHDSVLQAAHSAYRVKLLRCDERGYVVEEHLKRLCMSHPQTLSLVSIIAAQNEIGTIQRLPELVRIVRDHCGPRVLVHVDATQLVGKYAVSVKRTLGDPDFVTGSSHKFHGPKGCGFMYVRDARTLRLMRPLLSGGGQELGMRSGTENLAGIVGMVTALQECHAHMAERTAKVKTMRDDMLGLLVGNLGHDVIRVNGDVDRGLYNTLNVTIRYRGEHNLAWLLDREGICVSSASACTKTKKSHVLEAIGVTNADMRKTVRISLSSYNTTRECAAFVQYVTWLYKNVLNK